MHQIKVQYYFIQIQDKVRFMKKIAILLTAVALTFATTAQAQIKFKHYPAKMYKGKIKPVTYNGYKNFRLGLEEGEATTPEIAFAGKYSYDVYGCGSPCIAHEFTNVITQKSADWDFQLDPDVTCTDGSYGAVEVRPYSRLLIVKGLDVDKYWKKGIITTGATGKCEVRFFVEKKGKLIRIK